MRADNPVCVVNVVLDRVDTEIEANANRYTFVWGNAIKTNKGKMEQCF